MKDKEIPPTKQSFVGGIVKDQGSSFQAPTVAHGQKAIDGAPVIVPEEQAQGPPGNDPVEASHVAVASNERDRTEGDDGKSPLEFGVFGSEGQELFNLRWFQTALFDLRFGIVGADVSVQMDKFVLYLPLAFAGEREAFGCEAVNGPVVLAELDHLIKQQTVVQDGGKAGRRQAEEPAESTATDQSQLSRFRSLI